MSISVRELSPLQIQQDRFMGSMLEFLSDSKITRDEMEQLVIIGKSQLEDLFAPDARTFLTAMVQERYHSEEATNEFKRAMDFVAAAVVPEGRSV